MNHKREDVRCRLLQAAYELVPEVGVAGLRTRDITARANLHLSTFHYCFESKDAFLQGLYQFIMFQFEVLRASYMGEGIPPRERLERRLQAILSLIRERPMALRAGRAFFSEAWVNGAVREIVKVHFAKERALITGWIVEGLEDGTWRVEDIPNPSVTASLILGFFDGLIFQSMLDPDEFPLEEYAASMTLWLGDPSAGLALKR